MPWKPAEDAACTAYIRQCLDHLDEYDSLSKELRFVQAETALDHAAQANALAQAHCSDPSSMKIVTAFARVIAVSRGELKADREHYKLNSAQ